MEALPFALPEAPPFLASLNALAPKLIRLTNGEVGGDPAASPSSIALSSIESEGELLLAKLLRRFRANGLVCEVGEPLRARLIEVRRLCWAWALAAAVVIGPGCAVVPFAEGGERPKSSVNFWPGAKEARRLDAVDGVGGGELSVDIFATV